MGLGRILLIWFLTTTVAWAGPTILETNPEFEPFLYRVLLPGSNQDIYMLGTQHDIPLNLFPKIVETLANRCDVFVEEVTPAKDEPRHFGELSWLSQDQLRSLGLYNKGGFGWETRADTIVVKDLKKEIQAPAKKQWKASIDQLHPVVLERYYSEKIDKHAYERGIEDDLEDIFSARGKTTLALENDEDRIRSEKVLERMVERASCFSFDNFMDFFPLYGLYAKIYELETRVKAENSPDLEDYASGDLSRFQVLDDPSIGIRNRNWIPKLKKIIEDNPSQCLFIGVGVAHLPGEDGLIRLLEKKGATVKRISKKGEIEAPLWTTCNYTKGLRYIDLVRIAAKNLIRDEGDATFFVSIVNKIEKSGYRDQIVTRKDKVRFDRLADEITTRFDGAGLTEVDRFEGMKQSALDLITSDLNRSMKEVLARVKRL